MARSYNSAVHKEGGVLIYLLEELTDARLRCDQLKRYIAEGVKLVNASPQRDQLFEVAGNLLYGIPETLFKLDKALDAAALAGSRLDYEELKQQLKPEKAQELEQVLNGARIRHIDRRSIPFQFASTQGETSMFKAASQDRIATALRRVASGVESGKISPTEASSQIHRVLMALSQTADQAVQSMGPIQADSREKVMEGFKSANPDLTDEQLEEIADEWEKNKNVVKDKQAASSDTLPDLTWEWTTEALEGLRKIAKQANSAKKSGLSLADKIQAQHIEKKAGDGLRAVSGVFGEVSKLARYEEGKPADPTENMSQEDADEWEENTEEHKDNFKSASYQSVFESH